MSNDDEDTPPAGAVVFVLVPDDDGVAPADGMYRKAMVASQLQTSRCVFVILLVDAALPPSLVLGTTFSDVNIP